MTFNSQPSAVLFEKNIEYFSTFSSQLVAALRDSLRLIQFEDLESTSNVYFSNKLYIQDLGKYISDIKASKSGVLLPRLLERAPQLNSPISAACMLGSTRDSVLDNIEILQFDEPSSLSEVYSSSICIGSLGLSAFLNSTDNLAPQTTIILLETSFVDLCISCHILDFSVIASNLKAADSKFEFIFGSSLQEVKNRFLSLTSYAYPTLPFGFNVFTDPRSSTFNLLISNWFKDPDGYSQSVQHMNGFADDFVNMNINTLLNYSYDNYHSLSELLSLSSSQRPIFLTSSGPSLLQSLSHLQDCVSDSLDHIVFSCGSSLGTLLSNGIQPHFCILLERDPEVYDILVDSFYQYPDSFKSISLICSITVDPRIKYLFKSVFFFDRPQGLFSSLGFTNKHCPCLPLAGPQVAVTGVEVVTYLGFKNVYLLGYDFCSSHSSQARSDNALGSDVRVHNIPVLGNQKRTLFTSPDLIFTRDILDLVIANNSNSSFSRLGEGLPLQNVLDITVQDFKNKILAQGRLNTPQELSSFIEDLPLLPNSCDVIQEIFSSNSLQIESYFSELRSVMTDLCSAWTSSSLQRFTALCAPLRQFFDYPQSDTSNSQLNNFVSRIIYSSLIILLLNIHDSHYLNSKNSSRDVNSSILTSISTIEGFINSYLGIMTKLAASAPHYGPNFSHSSYSQSLTRQ